MHLQNYKKFWKRPSFQIENLQIGSKKQEDKVIED